MGVEWELSTVGDFCPFVYGKALPERSRIPGVFPVISSAGISGSHHEPLVTTGGIVIGRKGTVGSVTLSMSAFWPIDTAFYVTDEPQRDLRFTYYLLRTLGLDRMNSDSAVPGLNRDNAHALTIFVPTLPEQRAIAHILGSLDDKIELNRQMNATLEAMAQALFQSWFVDFDPVIDNALAAGNPIPEPLQARAEARAALGDQRQPLPDAVQNQFPDCFVFNNELGWVPEGWEVRTIGDEVENMGGGTPSTKDPNYWEDGIHAFCTPKDMSTLGTLVLLDTERHLTDAGVNKISSGQLPKGTVLMSSRAPIGYLAISDIPVTVNQGIIAMLPNKKFGSMYLLNWAKANMGAIKDRANGSTFMEISKKSFRPIPFLVPNSKVTAYFNGYAQNLYEKLLINSELIQNLTQLRDTLLPKLLSGELRVPEAEKQVADQL